MFGNPCGRSGERRARDPRSTSAQILEHSEALSTFAVDDVDKAKAFYGEVLGLGVTDEMGGLQLSIEGSREIFVYPKTDYVPATYTVLNFPVENIDAAVDELARHG